MHSIDCVQYSESVNVVYVSFLLKNNHKSAIISSRRNYQNQKEKKIPISTIEE